ncbi:MAG: hypothetical protein RQM92_02230 [Candidatus Syntrophopropionicum ammoniitolerans]
MVDYIVVAKPENHMQTKATYLNPCFSGDIKMPLAGVPPLPLDERKIIGRRAAMELRPGVVVNMGIGMPEGVSGVAGEEGIADMLTLTTELGNFGGVPAKNPNFPASRARFVQSSIPACLIFMTAAGWIYAFWGQPRWIGKETPMSVSLVIGWLGRGLCKYFVNSQKGSLCGDYDC